MTLFDQDFLCSQLVTTTKYWLFDHYHWFVLINFKLTQTWALGLEALIFNKFLRSLLCDLFQIFGLCREQAIETYLVYPLLYRSWITSWILFFVEWFEKGFYWFLLSTLDFFNGIGFGENGFDMTLLIDVYGSISILHERFDFN